MPNRAHGKRLEHIVRLAIGQTDITVIIRVNGPDKVAVMQHLSGVVQAAVNAELQVQVQAPTFANVMETMSVKKA